MADNIKRAPMPGTPLYEFRIAYYEPQDIFRGSFIVEGEEYDATLTGNKFSAWTLVRYMYRAWRKQQELEQTASCGNVCRIGIPGVKTVDKCKDCPLD